MKNCQLVTREHRQAETNPQNTMFFLAYRPNAVGPMEPVSVVWDLSALQALPWETKTGLRNSIVCRDVTWSSMTVLVGTKKLGEELGRLVEGMGDVVPATFGWEVREGVRGDAGMVQAVGIDAPM